eukprot:153047-Chlamydomonas_euryale.AAC.2
MRRWLHPHPHPISHPGDVTEARRAHSGRPGATRQTTRRNCERAPPGYGTAAAPTEGSSPPGCAPGRVPAGSEGRPFLSWWSHEPQGTGLLAVSTARAPSGCSRRSLRPRRRRPADSRRGAAATDAAAAGAEAEGCSCCCRLPPAAASAAGGCSFECRGTNGGGGDDGHP